MKSKVLIRWQAGQRPKIGTVFGWDGYQYLHVDGGALQSHFCDPVRPAHDPARALSRHAYR